jgi:hypothetical protein
MLKKSGQQGRIRNSHGTPDIVRHSLARLTGAIRGLEFRWQFATEAACVENLIQC